jgi:hypothetical protein
MVIRAADLDGATVVTAGGRRLGRVMEIRAEDGVVTMLCCGVGGFWQRVIGAGHGREVAWRDVLEAAPGRIVVR